MAFGKSGLPALSYTPSSRKKRGRIGVARGKFEVSTSLDGEDPEIVRLLAGSDA